MRFLIHFIPCHRHMGVTISDRARFDKLIDARSIEPELYLDLDQISALRGNRVRIRGL